ncbi:MAG: citrate/2-methylcitrate synthase, partial [Steroidobacteraceae bacterium]
MRQPTRKYELKDLTTGRTALLDAVSGTIGPDVLNIAHLTQDLGVFTFDPGFAATASTESKITYIDGDAGLLLYRGYPVEQLAERSSFLEVANLLIYGRLPTHEELDSFRASVMLQTGVNGQLMQVFRGFDRDAHPMAMVSAAVASMAAFYHRTMDINEPNHREIFTRRILGKLPTIAAAAYRHARGQPIIQPRRELGYCENLLRLLFADPSETYSADPVAAEALDLLFILHADHEQNASTSTVRLAGSTGANPYAAISAGISALWGPAHGGANEAVLDMLEQIGSVARIDGFLARVKDKSDHVRLMGF